MLLWTDKKRIRVIGKAAWRRRLTGLLTEKRQREAYFVKLMPPKKSMAVFRMRLGAVRKMERVKEVGRK